jgi:hypothetical protein
MAFTFFFFFFFLERYKQEQKLLHLSVSLKAYNALENKSCETVPISFTASELQNLWLYFTKFYISEYN